LTRRGQRGWRRSERHRARTRDRECCTKELRGTGRLEVCRERHEREQYASEVLLDQEVESHGSGGPQARDVPALITGKTNGFPWVLPLSEVVRPPSWQAFSAGPVLRDNLSKIGRTRGLKPARRATRSRQASDRWFAWRSRAAVPRATYLHWCAKACRESCAARPPRAACRSQR